MEQLSTTSSIAPLFCKLGRIWKRRGGVSEGSSKSRCQLWCQQDSSQPCPTSAVQGVHPSRTAPEEGCRALGTMRGHVSPLWVPEPHLATENGSEDCQRCQRYPAQPKHPPRLLGRVRHTPLPATHRTWAGPRLDLRGCRKWSRPLHTRPAKPSSEIRAEKGTETGLGLS